MPTLANLVRATREARARTANPAIGTQVSNGCIQVVTVKFPPEKRGRAIVTPLSDFLPISDAVTFLDSLQ